MSHRGSGRSRRVHYAVATLAAAALLAGCGTPSPIADDAPVRISGRVVTEAGKPVGGATVTVHANAGLSDALAVLPGLNIACAGGGCRGLSEDLESDADGRVTVETVGKETKTAFGYARDIVFTAYAPGPPPRGALGRGASLQYFKVLTEVVDLPPLAIWSTGLTAIRRGDRLALGFSALPRRDVTYGWEVDDLQGNQIAYARPAGDRSVDARLLEDFPGRMSVSARYDDRGVHVVASSPVFPVKGTMVPPSRGAECARRDATGHPVPQRPCGLTDGNLRTPGPAPDQCPNDGSPEATTCRERVAPVELDLGKARPVSFVVVRGVTSDVRVSTSVDGRTWTDLGASELSGITTTSYAAQVTGTARQARFVRVLASDVPSEVSAW